MVGGLMGNEEILLRTPLWVLKLHVQRFGPAQGAKEQELGRHAALALRVGVQQRDPQTIRAALLLEQALFSSGGFDLLGPGSFSSRFLEDLAERLVAEIEGGRIAVEREGIVSLSERPDLFNPEVPPLPPPPKESTNTFFEVRFVDEVGQAINGLSVEFKIDGEFRDVTTNAAGVALLEDVKSSTAEVRVAEPSELETILDPRWSKPRSGKPPKEANTTRQSFQGGPVGPIGVKAVVSNTLVIEPPRGELLVQLFDKSGRSPHAELAYTIEGPEKLSGKTDGSGTFTHAQVFPGDYTLKFQLEFFEGKDKQVNSFESPLVVQSAAAAALEIRQIGAVPRCMQANLHAFFNTNRAFLLPTALPSVRALRKLYLENSPGKLLAVGHADTKGGAEFNDKLSLARARATIAYLKDDVDAWLAFYDSGVPEKQRWGKTEDHLMLTALPDFRSKPKGQDAVTWFQKTRKLAVDGKAGPETRRKLVTEYMGLDGTSLSEFDPDIEATAHGCGENFPLDDSGEKVDEAPQNETRDPGDRRVELFFFDAEFGILPAPPAENSKPGSAEYPAWRKRADEVVDLEAGELAGPKLIFVELADAHFRTDSAVVLPEGENPDESGEHEALSSAGLIATALRFNEENPNRSLLVAGHTDTAASESHNDELSKLRAKVALALLEGDRAAFQKTCNGRHLVSDIKQILSWVSRAFPDLPFDCDPGKINDIPDDKPVRKFQKAFNANKAKLGSQAADLNPDGSVGELTWGAFFDCYEFALRRELGEDAEGLASLRKLLKFADDKRKALGFGERFPVEELGVDEFRSQENRRVELIFFEPGEAPDLAQTEEDPDTAELYLPGNFKREGIQMSEEDLIFGHLDIFLHSPLQPVRTDGSYRLFSENVAFDVTLPSSAATPESEQRLALRFPRLNRRGAYTLEQILGESRTKIFENVPFSVLVRIVEEPEADFKGFSKSAPNRDFIRYDLDEALEERG